MNWQHLTYFGVVAETQNFTKAAQQLYITPSALSRAISALEEELGVPLFVKSGRNSVLTEYGKIFQIYVNQSMRCIEEGTRTVQSRAEILRGGVSILGIHTMCVEYLPKLVKNFVDLYPNVKFTVGCGLCEEVLEQVQAGKVDIGFSSDYDANLKKYQNLERVLLKREKYVIVTSLSHSLSEISHITFDKLKDEFFITNKNIVSRNRYAFYQICESYNITPKIAFELPDDQSILGMVAAGLGVSLMADVPSMHRNDLHIIQLDKLQMRQHQYMVWKKGSMISKAAEKYRDYVREVGIDNNE